MTEIQPQQNLTQERARLDRAAQRQDEGTRTKENARRVLYERHRANGDDTKSDPGGIGFW